MSVGGIGSVETWAGIALFSIPFMVGFGLLALFTGGVLAMKLTFGFVTVFVFAQAQVLASRMLKSSAAGIPEAESSEVR